MSDKIISIGNQIIKMGGGMLGYEQPFTPYDISSMIAWYDASDVSTITKTNDYISQWRDKSINEYHLNQSSAISQPLYVYNVLNGNSIVRFDGVNDYMLAGFGTTYTQPLTVFIVQKCTNNANTIAAIFDNFSIAGISNYSINNTLQFGAGAAVNLQYPKTTPYLYFIQSIGVFNTTASSIYENGVLKAAGDNGSGTLKGLTLGAYYAANNHWFKGDFAEIIIYKKVLTTTELTNINNYLNSKYLIY